MKQLHYDQKTFSLEIVKKLQNIKAAKKQSSGGIAANVINVKSCPTVAMRKSALEKSDLELL